MALPPLERGLKPFHPAPFMFQSTRPLSCSVQICKEVPSQQGRAGVLTELRNMLGHTRACRPQL